MYLFCREGSLAWFFFFFSSRRRHTRYWRDWSSDVCSSDLEHWRSNAEQRFVEPAELAGRAAHPAAGLDLRDEVRLVVELVDLVGDHLQASVRVDDRQDVPAPVHGSDSLAEGGLLVPRDAQAHVLEPDGTEHLVTEVLVDRAAIDPLDDRAEDLPAARRVVGGVGARLPSRRRRRDVCHDLAVGQLGVEQLGVGVREATGVREHVADRAPLLAGAPAVDVLADPVVEAELALLHSWR